MAMVSGWMAAILDDINFIACVTAKSKTVNQQQYNIYQVSLYANMYSSGCHEKLLLLILVLFSVVKWQGN